MAEEKRAEIEKLTREIEASHSLVHDLRAEIGRVIVGQHKMVDALLIGLFCRGHILIEGVPGLAKTRTVNALAASVEADFKRIQFTPDLLPADLIGTEVFRPKSGDFTIKTGPIFHNIILADEINRAPSKVQSALLEAMQERQVTIGEATLTLADPFLVLATQNPIEQEGTYPLPEAQIDRFMLKILLDYPSRREEKQILERVGFHGEQEVRPVIRKDQIGSIQDLIQAVFVDEKLREYMVDIIHASRRPADYGLDIGPYVQYGASPRATIFLSLAARAHAFLQGRAHVTPHDIKTVAGDVLRHRIILSYEAEAEDISADQLVVRIFEGVEVP